MANPQRVPDPRYTDPVNPIPPTDPYVAERPIPANSEYPAVVNNRVEERGSGTSVMIAAVVLVLAVIAYFVFAPGADNTVPGDPAVVEQPVVPAPDAAAPPAPSAMAPDAMAPAPAPAAPPAGVAPQAPVDAAPPAPESAVPAPAPAPAQAPAQ